MWKDKESHSLLSTYHMPGSELSNGKWGSSYMNFADEVAETQRLNNLSKIDQGMNGEVRVQM